MRHVLLLASLRTLAVAALFALGTQNAGAAPLDTTFEIDEDSLVAISSARNYPPDEHFDVHSEDAAGGKFELTFSNVFFPQIDVGSGETFDVVLPDGVFVGLYDPADGSVQVASITVQITKRQNGSISQQGNFTFDLTTGTQSRSQCGSAGPSSFTGIPLDPDTGEFVMLENACIFELGGQPFNQVFSLKLDGHLVTVPGAAAPEPAAALLLGLGLCWLARRRSA